MCQVKVFEYMKGVRDSGDNKYYTVSQIRSMLESNGIETNKALHEHVTRLWWFGFFEKDEELEKGKGKVYNRRLFRAKA